MNDMEVAKATLEKEDLAMVVVKDEQILFKSKEKGIKPMYTLATTMKREAYGAALADRVIGKGAAILAGYIGIKEIFTYLISEGGIRTLEQYKIPYTMNNSCLYIKNREKTGYCPIEKLSVDVEEPELLLEKIEGFLEGLK